MPHISIIIPARNEAVMLPSVLQAIGERSVTDCQRQIIVVDDRSTDDTAQAARVAGAEVVEYKGNFRGRAALLNEGARRAAGGVLFFLDADTFVPAGYDADILATLRIPNCVGGAFEFKLDGPEPGLRLVEVINRLRYRLWPWYYGDQGIFVRRDVFEQVGGYPLVRLMEASDFCRSVAAWGDMRLVHKDMLTSPRRFLAKGIYRVLGFDIRMWWRNLIGRDVEQFAMAYWSQDNRPGPGPSSS